MRLDGYVSDLRIATLEHTELLAREHVNQKLLKITACLLATKCHIVRMVVLFDLLVVDTHDHAYVTDKWCLHYVTQGRPAYPTSNLVKVTALDHPLFVCELSRYSLIKVSLFQSKDNIVSELHDGMLVMHNLDVWAVRMDHSSRVRSHLPHSVLKSVC